MEKKGPMSLAANLTAKRVTTSFGGEPGEPSVPSIASGGTWLRVSGEILNDP